MSTKVTRCICSFVAILFATSLMAESPAKRPAKKKRAPHPSLQPTTDVDGLPRVLLIGDSISMGYTVPTRAALKDKANVHRIPTNGGDTNRGIESIESWLGKSQWDVIHFNWGLHDLKFNPNESPEKGNESRVPLKDYIKNLEKLVTRMKQTKAKLIFATTTDYPKGVTPLRRPEDAIAYNAAAIEVMKKHGVAVNDLYAFTSPRLKELQRERNVHFTPEGSKVLGAEVSAAILSALGGK